MENFFAEYGNDIVQKSLQHLYISAVALVLGVLVAVPLGVLLTRFKRVATIIISVTSALQTVPSLAY